MKCSPEGDDAGPAGDATGELECPFDGFRAGVAEEDGVERVRTRVRQHGRQLADRL